MNFAQLGFEDYFNGEGVCVIEGPIGFPNMAARGRNGFASRRAVEVNARFFGEER